MSSIVPSPPKKVTVASSPSGWLSIVGQALAFALVSAGAAVAGVVDTAAQTFAGVKTFTSAIIASAGIQLSALWNTNGTGASDVGVKIGVSTADASVNASAKLLSMLMGIGSGSEVEKFSVRKGGSFVPVVSIFAPNTTNTVCLELVGGAAGWGGMHWIPAGGGRVVFGAYGAMPAGVAVENRGLYFTQNANAYDAAALMRWEIGSAASVAATVPAFDFRVSAGLASSQMMVRWQSATVDIVAFTASGRIDQSGTDSSGTPGAAIINKPTGKSAIAATASSVVITNSLVTASSRINITPMENGTSNAEFRNFKVTPAAGNFTVTLNSAVTVAWPFAWDVATIL